MTYFERALAALGAGRPCASSIRLRAAAAGMPWLIWLLLCWGSAVAAPGPSVRDVVEWTRIIQPASHDADLLRSQISPDGMRAFIVTRKADVATDRNVYEILVLDVARQHLEAGHITPPRKLLSVSATLDEDYAQPFLRDVRWMGNGMLVFRARIHDGPTQVYKLTLESGELAALTSETQPIVSFAVSDDLRRLVYLVQVANPPMAAGAHSVVVGSQSFWSVKFGQNELRSQDRRFRYMTTVVGQKAIALGPVFPASSGFEQGRQHFSRRTLGPLAALPAGASGRMGRSIPVAGRDREVGGIKPRRRSARVLLASIQFHRANDNGLAPGRRP